MANAKLGSGCYEVWGGVAVKFRKTSQEVAESFADPGWYDPGDGSLRYWDGTQWGMTRDEYHRHF